MTATAQITKVNRRLTATAEKDIFAVMVNTDLTEGRGHDYPIYFTSRESTAIRLGKGRNVQGSNARIVPTKAFYIKQKGSYGQWFTLAGNIIQPNDSDLEAEKQLKQEKAKNILIERFKKGENITEEERTQLLTWLNV